MTTVRVLICPEHGQWVAQCLEIDIASQDSATMLGAVETLGFLFDARDQIVAEHPGVAPVPPAPPTYEQAWNAGDRLGQLPLGRARIADLRIGVSPFDKGAK